MVTCPTVFYRPFCKPIVHRVVDLSIQSPSRWLSFAECSWFVYFWCFCLATCLRVVWSSDIVMDPMFWQVVVKIFVSDVGASITNHHPWNSESQKYCLFKHLFGVLSISSSTWHGFNPLGDIVNCHQDIFIVLWLWKQNHVIDTLDIEKLNLEVGGEWHGISLIDIPVPLTCSTPPDEVLHVFIHGWPKKSTLLDLCMSAECTIVSSIWWWVASFYDLDSFFC